MREEGLDGSQPEGGSKEAGEVESNRHAQSKSSEGHRVAERGTRSRASRMEEEEDEDGGANDPRRIRIGVKEVIHRR